MSGGGYSSFATAADSSSSSIHDRSLDSTRRMLQLCEEGKEAGIRTLVSLDDQGDQLDKIETGLDQINTDMKEAEKNLKGMESNNKCCGICWLPWRRKVPPQVPQEEDDDTHLDWEKKQGGNVDETISNQPIRVRDMRGEDNRRCHGSFGVTTRSHHDARDVELDENMDQISNVLGNLRNIAVDMGSEIESQNRQLDRVNVKAQSNESRIQVARERTNRIMKK